MSSPRNDSVTFGEKLETAFDSSVRDIADAPADVMAQYDAKRDVTQLKKCIDALLDVSAVCMCVCVLKVYIVDSVPSYIL